MFVAERHQHDQCTWTALLVAALAVAGDQTWLARPAAAQCQEACLRCPAAMVSRAAGLAFAAPGPAAVAALAAAGSHAAVVAPAAAGLAGVASPQRTSPPPGELDWYWQHQRLSGWQQRQTGCQRALYCRCADVAAVGLLHLAGRN